VFRPPGDGLDRILIRVNAAMAGKLNSGGRDADFSLQTAIEIRCYHQNFASTHETIRLLICESRGHLQAMFAVL
jgi:hypothetical protein